MAEKININPSGKLLKVKKITSFFKCLEQNVYKVYIARFRNLKALATANVNIYQYYFIDLYDYKKNYSIKINNRFGSEI